MGCVIAYGWLIYYRKNLEQRVSCRANSTLRLIFYMLCHTPICKTTKTQEVEWI